MANITFIGLGWVSKAAALHFNKLNYKVKGTKRTAEKIDNIEVYSWSLANPFPPDAVSENIVISIASRTHELYQYELLFKDLQLHSPKNIIFLSTTSVYGNKRGILEETTNLSDLFADNLHLQISELFLKYFPSGIVLRLAGLVGPGRNPVNFFAGKQIVLDPQLNINLVHQIDVVRAMVSCIDNNAKGIYNVCSSTHSSRQEFYTKLSEFYRLSPPQFAECKQNDNIRIVSNAKLKSELNFKFNVDDVLSYYLSSEDNE